MLSFVCSDASVTIIPERRPKCNNRVIDGALRSVEKFAKKKPRAYALGLVMRTTYASSAKYLMVRTIWLV